MQDVNN